MKPTLESMLGLAPSSPDLVRAEQLADNDRALLRALVEIRRQRGLTQADVGAIMGVSQPSVADFEAHDANPTLSRIRRYAHAVRALIVHKVECDEGQLLDSGRRNPWVTTSVHHVPIAASGATRPGTHQVIQVASPMPGGRAARTSLPGDPLALAA